MRCVAFGTIRRGGRGSINAGSQALESASSQALPLFLFFLHKRRGSAGTLLGVPSATTLPHTARQAEFAEQKKRVHPLDLVQSVARAGSVAGRFPARQYRGSCWASTPVDWVEFIFPRATYLLKNLEEGKAGLSIGEPPGTHRIALLEVVCRAGTIQPASCCSGDSCNGIETYGGQTATPRKRMANSIKPATRPK
eukprot:GHVT01084641.1.p1 GENE.GHVT01084641.1~~GHVT01084641.1.p1  ORF type:complete len:195 (-),score=14.55 GHVT01084641.1:266-850(-)